MGHEQKPTYFDCWWPRCPKRPKKNYPLSDAPTHSKRLRISDTSTPRPRVAIFQTTHATTTATTTTTTGQEQRPLHISFPGRDQRDLLLRVFVVVQMPRSSQPSEHFPRCGNFLPSVASVTFFRVPATWDLLQQLAPSANHASPSATGRWRFCPRTHAEPCASNLAATRNRNLRYRLAPNAVHSVHRLHNF